MCLCLLALVGLSRTCPWQGVGKGTDCTRGIRTNGQSGNGPLTQGWLEQGAGPAGATKFEIEQKEGNKGGWKMWAEWVDGRTVERKGMETKVGLRNRPTDRRESFLGPLSSCTGPPDPLPRGSKWLPMQGQAHSFPPIIPANPALPHRAELVSFWNCKVK